MSPTETSKQQESQMEVDLSEMVEPEISSKPTSSSSASSSDADESDANDPVFKDPAQRKKRKSLETKHHLALDEAHVSSRAADKLSKAYDANLASSRKTVARGRKKHELLALKF